MDFIRKLYSNLVWSTNFEEKMSRITKQKIGSQNTQINIIILPNFIAMITTIDKPY